MKRLVRQRPKGILLPIEPRLEAWKIEHVPGRAALRRELGPRGKLGRALRALPVVYQTQGCLFLHAGLPPDWAELGVDGLIVEGRRGLEWTPDGTRVLWNTGSVGVRR